MAQQQRAERTRTQILDAAAEVIDQHGFQGARLSGILATAGVTKGAFYFHFSSKEELAHALVDEQFSVDDTPTDPESLGLQQIIDLTHQLAHALQTNVRVRASVRLTVETGSFVAPRPEPYLRWIGVARRHVEAALHRGDLHKGLDPNVVATWISGSFLGIQIQSEVLTGRADVHERVTDMWRIALPGLVPPWRLAAFSPSGTVPPAQLPGGPHAVPAVEVGVSQS
ncbi:MULTISPECIES: ScbR family autoregulator-binding transcription factor [Actinokineospora]|uniref:Gamma-butyrolactone-binding protein n=1 Tax=Actinokineospora fastidiosa TaxID=1816 RepID=A0A918GS36_9PSEU|nr:MULTISPECIES: ScbR family autoregulator-binding transcription factor [Actinokineospora]UVS81542.1 A-factor-binding protein [Actinokineospora sp. UTMC 2448]GGS57332.1 gamma-butyrolactone-binding protein [Actinokineospora fastidiosa]